MSTSLTGAYRVPPFAEAKRILEKVYSHRCQGSKLAEGQTGVRMVERQPVFRCLIDYVLSVLFDHGLEDHLSYGSR